MTTLGMGEARDVLLTGLHPGHYLLTVGRSGYFLNAVQRDDSVYEHAEDQPPFRLGGLFLFMQDVYEQSNRASRGTSPSSRQARERP